MPDDTGVPAGEPMDWVAESDVLTLVKRQLEINLGTTLAESLRRYGRPDRFAQHLSDRFETTVLAEELPPQAVRHTDLIEVHSYATWLDHFAATYRDRWWGWCLGLDLREIRYVIEEREHTVQVTLVGEWHYPRATVRMPELGEPVLNYRTSSQGWMDDFSDMVKNRARREADRDHGA